MTWNLIIFFLVGFGKYFLALMLIVDIRQNFVFTYDLHTLFAQKIRMLHKYLEPVLAGMECTFFGLCTIFDYLF